MKKSILLLFCFAIAIGGFSQSDVSGPGIGHRRQPGLFCGWSPGINSIAGSFDVKNVFPNQPINFFAGGSTPAFQRMTILGTNGFVGIGAGFTTPRSLLHLDDINTNDAFIQFTNTISGNANNTSGVKVGITYNGNAEFHNYFAVGPIDFYTSNTNICIFT